MLVTCPECGAKLACEFKERLYGYQRRCNKCQNKKSKVDREREGKQGPKRGPAFVGRYKDVVAFGTDRKTGREVGISTDGKRVDPSRTRYDLRGDPRGWKVTGKKVRDTDRQGLKTNR